MGIHFNFIFYFIHLGGFNDGDILIMLINFLLAIVSKFSGSILTIVIVRLLSWSTSTWHYFARLCLVGLVHSLTCYFLLNNRSIHLGNVASNILAMAPAILLSIMPGNVVAILRSVLFCLWLVLLLLESAAATELTVYASAQIIDNFIDKWADEHDVRQRRVKQFLLCVIIVCHLIGLSSVWFVSDSPSLFVLTSVVQFSTLVLAFAAAKTQAAPLTDTALLSFYYGMVSMLGSIALRSAPLTCNVGAYLWSFSNLQSILPPFLDLFARIASPMATLSLLLALGISRGSSSRDLLSAALYTVIGGELIYLCGEETSPVWRVAPQCLSSLAYYWWSRFGGGRVDSD